MIRVPYEKGGIEGETFFVIFLFLVVLFIASLVALGGGYLLATLTAFTLEFASILFLLSTFLIGMCLMMITQSDSFQKAVWQREMAENVHEILDNWEDLEKPKPRNTRKPRKPRKPIEVVGRNRICPCGSGKKYKFLLF